MTKTKKPRRVEAKLDADSIYLLIYNDNPIFWVHGAYSTEGKMLAELKRLSKLPENKLTRKQKRHNKTLSGAANPTRDPMDCYSIREIVVL